MTKPANLRVREAADELQVGQHGVLGLIDTGALPAFDVSKPGAKRRTLRISREALDDFIRDRTCQMPQPKRRRRRRRTKETATVRKYF